MASRFVLTAQLRLAGPGSANLKAIVANINRSLAGINPTISINVTNVQKQLNSLNTSFKGTSKTVRTAANDIERFGEQAAIAIRRYGAFTLATGSFIKLISAISGGVDEAIKFDRELVRVSQVTGQSVQSLSSLSKEITRVSTQFGVSSTKLLEVSVTLAQAGLSAKDTKIALEALGKTGVSATFGDITNTTEAAIAIMQQFKVEAKDLESVLSSVNKVSAAFAVESDDISVAVRRAGGAFQAAGGNLNEFIALFTSVRQTTRESAESIATGFRTIFTRLQRVKTQDFFKGFGVELRDLENQFVGPYEAIRRISAALKDIESTDPRFSQIVEELGGFRQVSKVVPLLQQFAVSEKALSIALRGGNSLTEDAAIAQDALAVKIQKVKEEFADLIRTITNDASFRGMIDVALELSKSLIQLTKSIVPLLPLLSGFGAIAAGRQLSQFGTGFKRKILGFSKGGMVPGHGNTDSVPALLTPGEFVINKRSVQKFASGGLVDSQGRAIAGKAKGLTLNEAIQAGFKRSVLSNAFGKSAVDSQIGTAVTANRQAQRKNKDVPAFNLKLNTGAGSKTAFGMVRPEVMSNPSLVPVNSPATAIINARGGKVVKDAFVQALGLGKAPAADVQKALQNTNVSGFIPTVGFNPRASSLFEGRIERIFSASIEGFVRNFFPKGSLLDPEKPPALSQALSNSAIKSIRGSFFEGIIRRAQADFNIGKKDEIFDFRGPGKTFGNLGQLLNGTPIFPSDAKAGAINRDKLSVAAKGIKTFGAKALKFSSGGGVPGSGNTDTVPALLTPGEFVVNKRAVGKIGVNNLRKINKYNRGGLVGNVVGGLSNPIGAFAALSIIQSFTNGLTEANSELANLVTSFNQTALRIVTFGGVVAALSNNNKIRAFAGTRSLDRGFAVKDRPFSGFLANATPNTVSNILHTPGGFATFENRRQARLGQVRAGRSAQFRNTVLSGAGLAAGGIASFGGEFIANRANERIARGEDATFESRAGSILSGAGTGAAIGAAFGPRGVAIGAATGALVSWTTTLGKAEKALASARFDIAFEKFSGRLEQFGKGRLTARDINTDVQNQLTASLKRVALGGTEAQDAKAGIKNAANTFDQFFAEMAKSSVSLDDFNRKTNGSLATLALLTDVPIAVLNESIEQTIKAQKAEKDSLLQLKRLHDVEIKNVANAIALAAAFQAAAEGITIFSDNVDAMIGLMTGNVLPAVGKTSQVFEQAAQGNVSDTTELRRRASGIANAAGLGQDSVDEVVDTTRLLNQLPNIIQEFNRQAATSGLQRQDADELITQIARQSGINNPSTLSNLSTVVRQELGGAFDEQKVTRLFENPLEAAEKLRPKLNTLVDIFGKAATHISEREKAFDSALKKIVELELKRIDIASENLAREQDFSERIREFREQPTSFGAGLSQLGARIGVPLGGGNGLNVDLIGRLRERQASAANLRNQFDASGDLQERFALKRALTEEESEIQKLNKALGTLINDTSALSAGFKELEQEEAKRRFRGRLVRTGVFGSNEEKISLSKVIAQVRNVALAGNDINVVPPNMRRDVEQFLSEAGEIPVMGQSGNARLEAIIRKEVTAGLGQGASPEDIEKQVQTAIKGGTTDRQKEIIAEMQLFITQQNDANTELANMFGSTAQNVEQALIRANDVFLAKLQQIFIQQQAGQNEQQLLENNVRGNELAGFIDRATQVGKQLGVNPNDTEGLIAGSNRQIDILKKQFNAAKALKDLRGGATVDTILDQFRLPEESVVLQPIPELGQAGGVQAINPEIAKQIKAQFAGLLDTLTPDARQVIEERIDTAGSRADVRAALGNAATQADAIGRGANPEQLSSFIRQWQQFVDEVGQFGGVDKAQAEQNKLLQSNNILANQQGRLTEQSAKLEAAMMSLANAVTGSTAPTVELGEAVSSLDGPAGGAVFGPEENPVKVRRRQKQQILNEIAIREAFERGIGGPEPTGIGARRTQKTAAQVQAESDAKRAGMQADLERQQSNQAIRERAAAREAQRRANFNEIQGRVRGTPTGQFSVPPEQIGNASLNNTVNSFNSSLNKFGQTISNVKLPDHIDVAGNHRVEVIINGSEVLTRLDKNIKDIVENGIYQAFAKYDTINSLNLKNPVSPKQATRRNI